jgi:hypothetical protein
MRRRDIITIGKIISECRELLALKEGYTLESFLDVFIGYWDHWMNAFERDTYGARIILKPGQYLSDVFEAKAR